MRKQLTVIAHLDSFLYWNLMRGSTPTDSSPSTGSTDAYSMLTARIASRNALRIIADIHHIRTFVEQCRLFSYLGKGFSFYYKEVKLR